MSLSPFDKLRVTSRFSHAPLKPTDKVPLVLASGSPRRFEIFSDLKLDFKVQTAGIDESRLEGELLDAMAERLALAKAGAVAEKNQDALIVAADSIVGLPPSSGNGAPIGKPLSDDDARAILSKLSGRTHHVITAIAFIRRCENFSEVAHCKSEVVFKELSHEVIESYIASGEHSDKAGAYAIQGKGAALVESYSGSYTNIVGLPISLFLKLAVGFGIERLPWGDN